MMPQRLRVGAAQHLAAAATGRRLEGDGGLRRLQQRSLPQGVAGLTAATATRGRSRRGPLGDGRVGGGGPGRIGGVLAEPLFEFIDAALQGSQAVLVGLHQIPDRGLSGRRDLVPEVGKDRGPRSHASDVLIRRWAANVGP